MTEPSASPPASVAALLTEEVRHQEIIASLKFAIVAVDEMGSVLEWNREAARLLGLSKAQALGRSLARLPVGWAWPDVERYIRELSGRAEPVRCDDVDFERPDGTRGILGITLTPFEAGAQVGGFLLTAADVSQRRELEHQLNQAQKLEAVGRLAAGIAHEINTPTQFVGDNLRFLSDAFEDLKRLTTAYRSFIDSLAPTEADEEATRALRALADELDLDYLTEEIPRSIAQGLDGISRVADIVGAMKEFSHPSGTKDFADLNAALERTAVVSRNEWKYVADLRLELDPDLPLVNCWLGELNQAFLNLVVNAAHAIGERYGFNSERKGSIVVTSRMAGDGTVEIAVRDDGVGMTEDVRLRCFEQFFTTKEVGKGTGQGLAIVHRAVSKHDGAVRVDSTYGEGTTFSLRLPVGG